MNSLSARQLFTQAVNQADEDIDLIQAALYIALEEYPSLDIQRYLHQLDEMAGAVRDRIPTERYPMRVVKAINQYLFHELGFRGNTDDYYNPRNSFLNDVIDRRTGIPISLSLVYLAVAERVGFPIVGIGMPGHFLISPVFEGSEIFIDPFNQGEILFAADCEERLAQIYSRPVELKPSFIEPVTPRRFLVRMLANLKVVYMNQKLLYKALCAVERMLLVLPNQPLEIRDRGLLYFQLGQWRAAAQDLEAYLLINPYAEDARVIEQLLDELRRI